MKLFDIKPKSMSESCKNACEPTSNMIIMGYFYRTKFVLCFAVAAVSPLLVFYRCFVSTFVLPLNPQWVVWWASFTSWWTLCLGLWCYDMIWDILYVLGCCFVICDMCRDVLCCAASPVPRECGGWASPMHRPTPTSCRRHSVEESAYIC